VDGALWYSKKNCVAIYPIDDSGNQDLELVGPQVLLAKTKLGKK
jgi:hypothetical protein